MIPSEGKALSGNEGKQRLGTLMAQRATAFARVGSKLDIKEKLQLAQISLEIGCCCCRSPQISGCPAEARGYTSRATLKIAQNPSTALAHLGPNPQGKGNGLTQWRKEPSILSACVPLLQSLLDLLLRVLPLRDLLEGIVRNNAL